MLVVISPAKTLDYSPLKGSIGFSEPLFIDKTESLVKEMRNYDPEMLSSLMKISENLGFLNFERFQTWKQDSAPGIDSKQSVFAFQGDVYKGLDISSLDEDVVNYSQKYLRILSGLYGLLKPLDLIAPYRLEMGTKLKIGDSSNLYEFWKPYLTNAINKDLKIQNEDLNDGRWAGGRRSRHPFINSELGQYMDHLKGYDRKAAMTSKKRDLTTKQKHPYWKTLKE